LEEEGGGEMKINILEGVSMFKIHCMHGITTMKPPGNTMYANLKIK
jgi:hypothetical protein